MYICTNSIPFLYFCCTNTDPSSTCLLSMIAIKFWPDKYRITFHLWHPFQFSMTNVKRNCDVIPYFEITSCTCVVKKQIDLLIFAHTKYSLSIQLYNILWSSKIQRKFICFYHYFWQSQLLNIRLNIFQNNFAICIITRMTKITPHLRGISNAVLKHSITLHLFWTDQLGTGLMLFLLCLVFKFVQKSNGCNQHLFYFVAL